MDSDSFALRQDQTAYSRVQSAPTGDVDRDLFEAMRSYIRQDLGLSDETAQHRARMELSRQIPRAVVERLGRSGVALSGKRVLDLGAGLGGMSEEALLSGAQLVSLEPGDAWAALTDRRLARHGRPYELLHAVGEQVPLADESVDVVVSLQVLEHVREPRTVLREAWRVLRPGGWFFLSCENYLSFYEPHYRVPWLPLLPKPLGAAYLRLLGRSPTFLNEAVTYITFPGVVGECRRLGFVRERDRQIAEGLASKKGMRWAAMRALATVAGDAAPRSLDDLSRYPRIAISELFYKSTD